MEKENYTEPEEQQQESTVTETETIDVTAEVIPDKDMLTAEPIIDRAHAKEQTTGGTVPEWTPPPYRPDAEPVEDAGPGKQAPPPQPKSEFANEDLKDLPQNEKEEAAGYLADVIIAGYGTSKQAAGNALLPIKKRRIKKLESEGLLNQDIVVNFRDGSRASIADVIANYNERATDVFKLRDGFVEEVRPLLIKELAKKGIGLTPMQRIIFAVGMDLFEDAKIAGKLLDAKHEMIEELKYTTAMWRQYNGGSGPAGPMPANQQTQQQSQASSPVTPAQPAPTSYQESGGVTYHENEESVFVQQPVAPSPPVNHVHDLSTAFDDIQNGRGGGPAILHETGVMEAPPTAVIKPKRRPPMRPTGKGSRGHYTKKSKPANLK